jgi:hypothetical protein
MLNFVEWACSLIAILGLSGCVFNPTPNTPLLTETPVLSLTPTSTIVWFPPTATSTPWSQTNNQSPTPAPSAQHGELIFQDDFTNPELWTLGEMPVGNIQLGLKEISIGISKSNGYLYSLRKGPALENFYLEITASPSICRNKDEYGVLIRVSSTLDYFRFGINCAGEARLDRVLSGQASSPQPPIMSGAIPPGAPSQSCLGVWAVGKEIRFYVNNEFQFATHDPSLPSGGIGIFARAAGPEAVSVNFSQLVVYQVQS